MYPNGVRASRNIIATRMAVIDILEELILFIVPIILNKANVVNIRKRLYFRRKTLVCNIVNYSLQKKHKNNINNKNSTQ